MWRSHQSDCLELCDRILRGGPRHVVASVTPGGGKSALPVILAAKLIHEVADRVCWLVPRAALAAQGQEVFSSPLFRSLLDHRMHVGAAPGVGWGFVATYQALLANQLTYRRAFQEHRYILVLDEPHHAPENSQWADALRPLVESCAVLVQMSGTFQRHDMKPVAFLPYQDRGGDRVFEPAHLDQSAVGVLNYPRKQALAEKSVIPLEVRWFDLSAAWKEDGQQQELFSLAAVEDEAEAKEGIYIALKSGAANLILMDCYQDWLHYRTINTRSKLLVVAATVEHARSFTATLKSMGAERVAIAVSADSKAAHQNIDRFKSHSGDRLDILVTVAMAYEGLDVPSCTHIACLTNIRSVPWIEQMATRATRVDGGEGALPYGLQTAYLYCPDDVLMRRCVEGIIEEQAEIAARPADSDFDAGDGDLVDDVGGFDAKGSAVEEMPPPVFEIIQAGAELVGLSDLQGDRLTKEEAANLPVLARVTGTPEPVLRSLTIQQIRGHLAACEGQIQAYHAELKPVSVATIEGPTKSVPQLRREATSLARSLDAQKRWSPGSANRYVRQRFCKSRTEMTAAELDRVCTWLRGQLR